MSGEAVGGRFLASGVLSTLNAMIDSREVLSALLIALVTGLVTVVAAAIRRRRRISWSVLYDEPINQGPITSEGPDMWEITSQGRQIEQGSLVVLDVRNSGGQDIEEGHFAVPLYFTFPGRDVEHFKVRDAGDLHDLIGRGTDTLPPNETSKIALPDLPLNRRDGFKLLVLLTGSGGGVRAGGIVRSGRIVEHVKHPNRTRVVAAAAAMALLIGVSGGVWLANRAIVPKATCTSGTLTIEGSTAFAPIATQVKNDYELSCPAASINVTANGSEQGVEDLARSRSTSQIAMSDGQPTRQTADGLTRRPAGVVMFAVVANRSLSPDLFTTGLSADELRSAFVDPRQYGYVAVGRTADSGTRATFDDTVLGGSDAAFAHARPCPAANGARGVPGACAEQTTMDLLDYIDSTPNAIGYAEADALPFFPHVGIVPVSGYAPTRENALSGRYSFLATEYLYTAGIAAGLTADYLQYLTSDAMAAELRGHGFIGCADLAGSKLDGACAD